MYIVGLESLDGLSVGLPKLDLSQPEAVEP
jgi:hypothetical protein